MSAAIAAENADGRLRRARMSSGERGRSAREPRRVSPTRSAIITVIMRRVTS